MWVFLDKTGKVKQYLMHGNSPIVGETDFQIFAYFDGLDIDFFDNATIKFRKPDRQGSTYPVLFMKKTSMTYNYMEGDGTLSKFNENHGPYTGFLFDFSTFTDAEEVVRLLDTPGLWEATITCLGAPAKTNVSGLITFNVGPAASDSESETEVGIDLILENLVLSAMILKKNSNSYLRLSDDFRNAASLGTLDPNTFTVGSVVFDKTSKNFYKILTVLPNAVDASGEFATYEKAFGCVRTERLSSSTTIGNAMEIGDGAPTIFFNADRTVAVQASENGAGSSLNFTAVDFATGNRYAGIAPAGTPILSVLVEQYYSQTPISVLTRDINGIHGLAEGYISGRSYSADDIVLKDGVFYRCITATTGPWNASAWRELTFDYIMGKSEPDQALDANSHNAVSNSAVTAALATKVDKNTRINNHPLSQNVDLEPSDLGMAIISNSEIDALFS